MSFDPKVHHRASTRLQGYDYTLAGAYFITLVTYQREMLFGEIMGGDVKLNRRGEIVREEWFRSAEIRKEIRLFDDEFVVMPNHVHGIVWIVDGRVLDVGATGRSPLRLDNHPRGPKPKSLSSFVAGFKSSVTKRIRNELDETGIWQRNYHACPEPVEGTASFAMTGNWIRFANTSKQIHGLGQKMTKIRC